MIADPLSAPAAEAAAPLLSARGLTKRYGRGGSQVTALGGVDLDLFPGELVAIMGASGSGKSTLMHLIGGIVSADGGTVRFGGQDLGALPDRALTALRRTRIGMIFQAYNLMPTLSAEQNIALPLLMDGTPRARALEQARAALGKVGLAPRAAHLPAQLSGGEQQRVAIARALVIEPKLVIADEPTGNLDSQSAQQVCALFAETIRGGERAVLLVTHEPTVAIHADRIVVLRDGKIVDRFARAEFGEVAALSQRYAAINAS